jgi:predicted dehydrogenase
MLKIGVLGAGHLGRIHLKLWLQVKEIELLGFFDPLDEHANLAETELKVRRFHNMDELIDACDAIDVVTPTVAHFDCASRAMKKGKHVFIEKPVTNTLDEAKKLLTLSREANVTVQVGHVERFNPAFVAAEPFCNTPLFIETHRLAQFNPRGTDVSVVLDLMIHDLDIVLSLNKSGIKKINASGVAVVSETPDIANARIEFNNGGVANLTASRISMKNMRKTRVFQRDAYISIDFLDKAVSIIRMNEVEGEPNPLLPLIEPGNGKAPKQIFFENPDIPESNAILEEFKAFVIAIQQNSPPPVSLQDGYLALEVAYKILEKMNTNGQLMNQ